MITIASRPALHYFQTSKPEFIRLWQRLTFLHLTISITKVIFGSTLFKSNNNINIVQQQVQEKVSIVNKNLARSVGHKYSDRLWMLHKYIGLGLSFIIFSRIIIKVRLSKEKKLSTKIRTALGYPTDTPEKKYFLFLQSSYIVFYILLIAVATTKLLLVFEHVEWLKPVHN